MRWPDPRAGAALCLGLLVAGRASATSPPKHPPEFWRKIKASDFAVPAGEAPLPLLLELSDSLGSTDPEIRDGFGYEIPVAWIYKKKVLGPDDLRVLLRKWTANLRPGIGETTGDSVLLRSFSALDLSILAAYDLEAPFLSPAEFESLLESALAYLADERDVRGYTPPVGWRHSCAHTADLLKFLARSPHLRIADQERILEAVRAKLTRTGDPVYVWGEDGRLARTVVSLVRRADFDPAQADAWLAGFAALHAKAWEGSVLDPALLAADRNAANLLQTLYAYLSQPTETAPAVAPMRTKLLALLAKY